MTYTCFCTVCQIIPPNILEQMAKSDDPAIRDMALANIAAAEIARQQRAQLAATRAQPAALFFGTAPKKRVRVVHDARRKPDLDGPVRRREGDKATKDAEVDEAYKHSGTVHAFYRTVFKRNSIDDAGMTLKSSVRFREDPAVRYSNAFWYQNQMAYGEGDGQLFKRFTCALEVIGHELSHGVVEYSANLKYQGQSGALNESFADVFGSMVKQWSLKQTAKQADWLIGSELFVSLTATRKALRSMAEPGTAYVNDPYLGTDPQPGHMKEYDSSKTDNGGVHVNSGIPNRAFFTVATTLGGRSWEKAGVIWYDALRRLRPNSDFHECAVMTYMSAALIYGTGSKEHLAVAAGWGKVGISL